MTLRIFFKKILEILQSFKKYLKEVEKRVIVPAKKYIKLSEYFTVFTIS